MSSTVLAAINKINQTVQEANNVAQTAQNIKQSLQEPQLPQLPPTYRAEQRSNLEAGSGNFMTRQEPPQASQSEIAGSPAAATTPSTTNVASSYSGTSWLEATPTNPPAVPITPSVEGSAIATIQTNQYYNTAPSTAPSAPSPSSPSATSPAPSSPSVEAPPAAGEAVTQFPPTAQQAPANTAQQQSTTQISAETAPPAGEAVTQIPPTAPQAPANTAQQPSAEQIAALSQGVSALGVSGSPRTEPLQASLPNTAALTQGPLQNAQAVEAPSPSEQQVASLAHHSDNSPASSPSPNSRAAQSLGDLLTGAHARPAPGYQAIPEPAANSMNSAALTPNSAQAAKAQQAAALQEYKKLKESFQQMKEINGELHLERQKNLKLIKASQVGYAKSAKDIEIALGKRPDPSRKGIVARLAGWSDRTLNRFSGVRRGQEAQVKSDLAMAKVYKDRSKTMIAALNAADKNFKEAASLEAKAQLLEKKGDIKGAVAALRKAKDLQTAGFFALKDPKLPRLQAQAKDASKLMNDASRKFNHAANKMVKAGNIALGTAVVGGTIATGGAFAYGASTAGAVGVGARAVAGLQMTKEVWGTATTAKYVAPVAITVGKKAISKVSSIKNAKPVGQTAKAVTERSVTTGSSRVAGIVEKTKNIRLPASETRTALSQLGKNKSLLNRALGRQKEYEGLLEYAQKNPTKVQDINAIKKGLLDSRALVDRLQGRVMQAEARLRASSTVARQYGKVTDIVRSKAPTVKVVSKKIGTSRVGQYSGNQVKTTTDFVKDVQNTYRAGLRLKPAPTLAENATRAQKVLHPIKTFVHADRNLTKAVGRNLTRRINQSPKSIIGRNFKAVQGFVDEVRKTSIAQLKKTPTPKLAEGASRGQKLMHSVKANVHEKINSATALGKTTWNRYSAAGKDWSNARANRKSLKEAAKEAKKAVRYAEESLKKAQDAKGTNTKSLINTASTRLKNARDAAERAAAEARRGNLLNHPVPKIAFNLGGLSYAANVLTSPFKKKNKK